MWNFGGPLRRCRTQVLRRDVLKVGALSYVGLTLPEVLRGWTDAAEPTAGSQPPTGRGKSVILIWMRGGPSHIDSFDMKPAAPVEIRGEFQPIATCVPGIQICEYLPQLAGIMDKLAIVRGIKSNDLGDHTPHYILTGSPDRGKRPAFGTVVSHLRPRSDGLPPYVSLMYDPPRLYDNEGPVFLDPSHRPFVPRAQGLDNLTRPRDVSLERMSDRRQLLREFDLQRRELQGHPAFAGMDEFTRRAMEMVTSRNTRDAFDLSREPASSRARYGKYCENFLVARRLVEAGIPVVTLKVGDWDTHEKNFRDMREQLPQLDHGFHALVNDLYERGLERDVAVVLWGEFGRDPRISRGDGRDHWPEAGAAVLAGGGFRSGQVIGATDSRGGRSVVCPYTPGNVLATLYQHLGIDPATRLLDRNRRPIPLLDDPEGIRELS